MASDLSPELMDRPAEAILAIRGEKVAAARGLAARQSNSAEGVRQHQPLGAAIRRLPQEAGEPAAVRSSVVPSHPDQALAIRPLFAVWPCVRTDDAAQGAHHAWAERWH